MGREIRRVPPHWEHPKEEYHGKMVYKPMFDRSYQEAIAEWTENHNLWLEGNHPDQQDADYDTSEYRYYAEYDGDPPSVDTYRPHWDEAKATWYQIYETVSEGTPVTPPFETQDELVNYLTTHGTFWDDQPWSSKAANNFVRGSGWLPSGVIMNGVGVDLTQETL